MDQQVYAMKIADIFAPEVKRKIFSGLNKKIKSIFPSPDTLYLKDIVKKNEINLTPLQIQTTIINNTLQLNSNNNISMQGNNSSLANSAKKNKLFEEDVNTPVKNKKHSASKFHYREKTISSNDLFSNYLKIDEELEKMEKTKYDLSFKKSSNNNNLPILNNNNNNNQEIECNNSNENTSTSSKDDLNVNNPNSNLKLNNKKEEDYGIDILKFNSDKSLNAPSLSASEKNNNNSLSSNTNIIDINININENNKNIDGINIEKSEIENDKRKNLFSRKEFSRFDFAKNSNKKNEGNENVNVPNFIFEIIKKKYSTQNFTKNIQFNEDLLYKDSILEKELNNSDQWAQYLYDNKNIDLDKELVIDFDLLNRSIQDKFTTFYLK